MKLDVANVNLLEDYSNYTASKEEIEASAKLTQALIANQAAKKAREAETGCKKPFLNIGKKKKAYEACLSDSSAKKAEAIAEENKTALELAKAKVEAAKYGRVAEDDLDSEKTFLGMPQTTGIVVTLIGLTALTITGIVLIKKMRS